MITIEFSDHGQDFLEWDINERGTVVESRPFQHWVWSGCKVLNTPRVKRRVRILTKSGDKVFIKYPLISVRRKRK